MKVEHKRLFGFLNQIPSNSGIYYQEFWSGTGLNHCGLIDEKCLVLDIVKIVY